MNSARPNSWRGLAPRNWAPMTRIDKMGSSATNDVLMERISVWFMDRLTMSLYVSRPVDAKPLVFSWTRSNTTMVSYSEYPRMVRNATTVAGVTCNPDNE